MTKKDYEVIAGALLRARPSDCTSPEHSWNLLVLDITEVLQEDNERFDRVRFLDACNYPANQK